MVPRQPRYGRCLAFACAAMSVWNAKQVRFEQDERLQQVWMLCGARVCVFAYNLALVPRTASHFPSTAGVMLSPLIPCSAPNDGLSPLSNAPWLSLLNFSLLLALMYTLG